MPKKPPTPSSILHCAGERLCLLRDTPRNHQAKEKETPEAV